VAVECVLEQHNKCGSTCSTRFCIVAQLLSPGTCSKFRALAFNVCPISSVPWLLYTNGILQVDSIGAVGDPGDVVLTMEAIEHTRYTEYRYTVLAGRVAAICGVQKLGEAAAGSGGVDAAAASERLHIHSHTAHT